MCGNAHLPSTFPSPSLGRDVETLVKDELLTGAVPHAPLNPDGVIAIFVVYEPRVRLGVKSNLKDSSDQ